MLNSSERFALILIPPFLVGLSNFYEKKSLQGIEPGTICLHFTTIATMPFLFLLKYCCFQK
jgi:di/tricarboxylate transporter